MALPQTSSAPRVKKALLEKFEAESALEGVQIAYAHPGVAIRQEAIYFSKTLTVEHAAALGRKRRDEDYTLDLVVDVAQDGDYAQQAEERCWVLVGIIETLLRPIPEVPSTGEPTGTVSGWVQFAGVEMTSYILDAQRLAEAICKLAVLNRK